jgi:hypothetical protein
MPNNKTDCLSRFVTANRGRNKRYSTPSTTNSAYPSTQSISQSFSKTWTFLRHPHTKRHSRPDNAEEILDERVENAFDEESNQPHNKHEGDNPEGRVVDDDICTDGGTVIGFRDTSHPQPWDNSQPLTVDDPHITRPLVKVDEPAVGFYVLTGQSVLSFPIDQTNKEIVLLGDDP